MERDYGAELDALRQQVDDVQSMLIQLGRGAGAVKGDLNPVDDASSPAGAPRETHIYYMGRMHKNEHIQGIIREITDTANERGMSGAISYVGAFESGGRQSNWVQHVVNVDDLIKLNESGQAAQVLSSIGSGDRLNLLVQLLRKPMTVAQLTEACGFGSIGQAYHHLKTLIAANLIEEVETERGVYAVVPPRVQGVVMLLVAVADLIDPKYARGRWDGETDQA